MSDVLVSVVVVTYNAPDKVRECLASVTGAAAPRVAHEVIALDNASKPSLVPLLREYLPVEQVVDVGVNAGFARSCNQGAGLGRGRYILFLNPDAVIEPGAIDLMVEVLERDITVGILGGGTVAAAGRTDPKSCWGAPTVWSYVCFATALSTIARGSRWLNPEALNGWDRETARDVPIITGCLMAVRRSAWDAVGGFDPDFFMYGEDADLCGRVRRAGLRVHFDPRPRALHHWGASSGSSGAKTTLLLAGRMTYVQKNFSGWRRPVASVLLVLGVALRAAAATACGRSDNGWRVAWGNRSRWVRGYRNSGSAAGVGA